MGNEQTFESQLHLSSSKESHSSTANHTANLSNDRTENMPSDHVQSTYTKRTVGLSIHPKTKTNMERQHLIGKMFVYKRVLATTLLSTVYLASPIHEPSQHYALKAIPRERETKPVARFFNNERNILKSLSHPNIVRLMSANTTMSHYYLITEYCSGGDLLHQMNVRNNQRFSEIEAVQHVINPLLNAIRYLHHRQIVHRDLKLLNIVFDQSGDDGILKLIDFGASEIIANKHSKDRIRIGTVPYMAPELWSKNRNKGALFKVDMWGIGVICFTMIAGMRPFIGDSMSEIKQKIQIGQYEWPEDVIVSSQCDDFISSLLCLNAETRLSASDALEHEWICLCKQSSHEYVDSMDLFGDTIVDILKHIDE